MNSIVGYAQQAAKFAFAACLFFLAQMPLANAESQGQTLPTDPRPLIAETASGEKSFSIEIADDVDERSTGLMFRDTMADDHGMLFVFEQTKPVGFWMKNTPLPLDLVFVGEDGRVRAVKQGEPQSEAVITPGTPVRFVLELKAGTAAKVGIVEGTVLQHPAIDNIAGAADPG
jgi:uncharacterized protein